MTAPFDFRNPDYLPVYHQRLERLRYLRENPDRVPMILAYYREHPWDLVNDWGVTFDPRNADVGLPTVMPFVLFPKQIEWMKWAYGLWKRRAPGVTEKSRDCGVSWLSVGLGVAIALTHDTINIGYGSRKQEYVDKKGAPKSLFWKAREFTKRLPPELTGGWDERRDAIENLIRFPTGSTLSGEVGDSIGRGDRAAIYFVDEAAHLEHPELVDQGLSATTNCRIDISSAKGTNNPFHDKVTRYPPEQVFTFHWRDDPRKDDEWYRKQCDELDAVTVAQEIDINYSASLTGVIIPNEWVKAAVDADKILAPAGFNFRGKRRGALDIADEGPDLNAFAWAQGVIVGGAEEWSGKGSDIFDSIQRAFMFCDDEQLEDFHYDADGMGASARGDARVINEERAKTKTRQIEVKPFRGSGEVYKPDAPVPTAYAGGGAARGAMERKNGDFFQNAKAQAWWALRIRFQRTFRAVQAVKAGEQAPPYDADDLIVLRSTIRNLAKLEQELSQPTYTQNTAGKIVVDKAPKLPTGGKAKSPNRGDSVMILMAPRKTSFLSYLD